MKEFVFLASLELCSPKESCMKEFVFLVMFEMCIAKEQRSSMALPVVNRNHERSGRAFLPSAADSHL